MILNERVVMFMHEKLLWTNDNIQFLFHGNIMEYDMVAASLSVSKRFQLLDNDLIEQLNLLPKKERTRRVGLLQRDDKIYSEKLLQGFIQIRKTFLENNGLSESNVLSLHSDACLFNSRKKIITNADGVEFRKKGQWTSYMRFNHIEMFYGDGSIEYKNVNKDMLMEHTMGINLYLNKVFQMIEDYDDNVLNYISRMQMDYLQDKLPQYWYPSFGKIDQYKTYNLKLFAFVANVVIQEMRSW
jgi:hypothetical protein